MTLLDFIKQLNSEKRLGLAEERCKELEKAIIEYARKEAGSNNQIAISDDVIEDLILDYEKTIKDYGIKKETSVKSNSKSEVKKPIAKTKTSVKTITPKGNTQVSLFDMED